MSSICHNYLMTFIFTTARLCQYLTPHYNISILQRDTSFGLHIQLDTILMASVPLIKCFIPADLLSIGWFALQIFGRRRNGTANLYILEVLPAVFVVDI